ncbi:MAG TPA: chloride channel protein [Thiobacillaceae bacterium]|nr:chloride channel protein [Thiobacillaceae bacterium]
MKRARRGILHPRLWTIRLVFWLGAAVVGLTAVFFAVSAARTDRLFHALAQQHPLLPLLITPTGFVLAAWLTRRFFPGAEGSGIPQVIWALRQGNEALSSRLLSIRIVIGKIALTLMGLISGASIGREGPTVHIGAAILYGLHRVPLLRLHRLEKTLIVAGGAAGIAAAFNTPLAGIVFAIEELSRGFEERNSGILITGVLIAGLTAIVLLGNYTYFGVHQAPLDFRQGLIAVPAAGILGGLAGGAFAALLVMSVDLVAPLRQRRPLLLAAGCGLAVALVGVLSGGNSYGTGYEEAKAIINGQHPATWIYPATKFVATLASYLSGIPGGLFAPSLSTGAGLGASLAGWWGKPSSFVAFAILGMAGYLAGVTRAPITSFVIVMEMTSDRSLTLALIATAFLASSVSRLLNRQPLYRTLASLAARSLAHSA